MRASSNYINGVRIMISKLVFVAVTSISLISGCASITQGTSQTLSFKLEPIGAKCVLTRTGDGELGSISSSSNTILVHKDKDDILAQCNALGYAQKTTRITSGATTAGVTGVLLDFGITDMITGAMYAYPTDISIVMEKESTAIPSLKAAALDSSNASSGGAINDNTLQKLRDLQTLRKDGVISEDEFLVKKKQLIEKL
jgi:hypothetical protein